VGFLASSQKRKAHYNSLDYTPRVSQTSCYEQVKRRRSSHYYFAKACLNTVEDLGKKELDLKALIFHFEKWLYVYDRKRFVKLNKGDEWIFIRMVNRFQKAYKRKLWPKLRKLVKIRWDLKIELTVDPKRFMTLGEQWNKITKWWNKLRSWMYKRYGAFQYLRILEATKKGRPHLHVLIWGVKRIPHEELAEIWDKYGGGFVFIRRIRKSVNAVWYVLKYVNKSLRRDNLLFGALLFASNRRLFSISNGLRAFVESKKTVHKSENEKYEYVGSCAEVELLHFCNEKRIELRDFMFITVEASDYYEFPSLFNADT